MRLIEEIIDSVEIIASRTCRIIQITLFIFIFIMIIGFSSYYVNHLIVFRNYDMHPALVGFYYVVGVYLMFNMVYNYIMCYKVGPGHPYEIQKARPDLINSIEKKCKKCSNRKPVRSHHCSICQKCILQMDHHCPWMGTCIGHYNRQYFINFLTYVTIISILYAQMMRDFRMQRGQVYIFMITLALVIGLFTIFHWTLVLMGRTTLQVCDIADGYKPSKSISTNLDIVFGSHNLFIMLLPMVRPAIYKGCEWQQSQQFQIQNLRLSETIDD